LFFVIPGDLETRTGGYGYDRRIIAGLRARGWRVNVFELDASFPTPTPAAHEHAAGVLAAIPDGSLVLVDGLALGALPGEIEREAGRLRIVALIHHPLAAETGIDPALASRHESSERRALAASRSVVVTGRATAAALAAYGVTADRLTVVAPGTDPAPLARGSAGAVVEAVRPAVEVTAALKGCATSSGDMPAPSLDPPAPSPESQAPSSEPPAPSPEPAAVSLLCVATLTPRKGYELLVRALAAVPHRNWRLTCAGSLDRDAATVARVRALIRDSGLEDRVSLVGDLDADALASEYDRADLFVLATFYEGYGMAVAEALARGLPVVSTATGAIEDLVRDAGLVVAPGDLAAFTSALAEVIADARLRARLAEAARRVRERLPTWDTAAAAMAQALGLRS
jgi:glycosyltransferase involved in cell wall biosynthesis